MKRALGVALLAAVLLSGCGRLRDGDEPAAPAPVTSELSTDELSDLIETVTDTLDEVNGELQRGDEAAEQE